MLHNVKVERALAHPPPPPPPHLIINKNVAVIMIIIVIVITHQQQLVLHYNYCNHFTQRSPRPAMAQAVLGQKLSCAAVQVGPSRSPNRETLPFWRLY